MKKKKNETSAILYICLFIVIALICIVGVFDFMVYKEISDEKNDTITTKTNIVDTTIISKPKNEKIVINNNVLCINNNCSNEATLGNYKIEYKDNKYYINNNELNIESTIKEISKIENEEYLNYLIIKLDNNNAIYNATNNTITNIN